MKITYDKEADAMAIILRKGRISKDVEIGEDVFAGYNRAGDLMEVQFLDVSEREEVWLTVEAAAVYLGKSEKTILRWIKAGKINPKKVGREYRIDPRDLEPFVS